MTHTKAQEALSKKLKGGEWTQVKLADALGVNQSAVSLWTNGKYRPGAQHRKLIASLLGIPEGDWLTRGEAAALRKADRRASGAKAAANG